MIGVVQYVGPLEIIQERLGERNSPEGAIPRPRLADLPKREVRVFDQAGILLTVLLWSYNAEEFSALPGTIVAFRNALLMESSEWNL